MENIPLAEKLRPTSFDDFIGQEHLIGKAKPLRRLIENGKITSMIFWGPPGCGKTSLSRLIAKHINAYFEPFSAVSSGVANVREVVARAKERIKHENKQTILFIDEIHRFSKAQQDAFLPHVEQGTIVLLGATTENPSFEVIWPLLSRTQIYVLYPLKNEEITLLIKRIIKNNPDIKIAPDAKDFLIEYSSGDARKVINAIEMAAEIVKTSKNREISVILLEDVLQKKFLGYDKKGENHYDTISAFIKSMRGGDPDAALHYLARMIKAGEDPVFIARRMVIFASEDVGNAQPTAMVLATSCMQAVHMVGMPESALILAQTAAYLASAKKSIASTLGIQEALRDLETMKLDPIPLHLRNGATALLKKLGYGAGHVRYPWLVEKQTGKKVNQEYLPKNLRNKKYYRPDWQ